jgi:hypothetical protein
MNLNWIGGWEMIECLEESGMKFAFDNAFHLEYSLLYARFKGKGVRSV